MKKITFAFLSCFCISFNYAQTFPLDFSDASDLFSGNNGSSASIVTNPAGCSGDGCTGDVLEINGAGDQFGDPVTLDLLNYVDLSDTANNTITLEFYASRAGNMLFQMSNASDGGFAVEIQSAVSVGLNSLSLDFDTATNAFPNGADPVNLDKYGRVAIFVDFGEAGIVATHWADNIAGGLDGGVIPTLPEPTDAPTAPPARNAADVISIYGDAYGAEVGLGNVPWDDPSVFNEETIAGNDVLKVEFGAFVGSNLGSVVDASAMTHFHMDYWIADPWVAGQVFNPKWSNHAGGSGETNAMESTIALPGDGTQNQTWVSYDIEISSMNDVDPGDDNAPFERADITQFLITVASLIDVAYVDNLYFYKAPTASIEDRSLNSFRAYPNPTQDNWTLKGTSQIQSIRVIDILGKEVMRLSPNNEEAMVDGTSLKSGIYFAQIKTLLGVDSVKLIKQ